MAFRARRVVMSIACASLAALASGCSTGPARGNSGFVVASGTCSGTPTSCFGLSGAFCSIVAGCLDTGSCIGVAATTGEACGAQRAFDACNSTSGCFWQANCVGQPSGTCSAITQDQCVAVPGCVWTPFIGAGGTPAFCDGGRMCTR